MDLPYLIFSDKKGKIYSHHFLRMACASLNPEPAKDHDLIKLPQGSSLFYLPGRIPLGFNPSTGEFEPLAEYKGRQVFAVGAFLIPAYLRLYNPAYITIAKKPLTQWAYTACGFYRGVFYAAARRIDPRIRQSPRFYDDKAIKKSVAECQKKYTKNRLYEHLAKCALNYNCQTAKNFFLKRWEAPVPTSQFCNARCIGCLSHQESDCVSSHQRIKFTPTLEEISQVMLNHLQYAQEAIVSFGQGCEGEPLLEARSIARAIAMVREKTHRGTINMNTNASLPDKIEMLCKAGIDSFRVSLNSARQNLYHLYFRPIRYEFGDVLKSISIAKKYKKFVSINLLVYPGVSDSKDQIKALLNLIKKTGIDMIQWRNLNIDPDCYLESISRCALKPQGVSRLLSEVAQAFPCLKMGYFNLPKEQFKSFKNVIQ